MKIRTCLVSNSSSSSFILPPPKNGHNFADEYWCSELKFYKLADMVKFCEAYSAPPDFAWSDSEWEKTIPSFLFYNCGNETLRGDIKRAYEIHPDWYVTKAIERGDVSYELYDLFEGWFDKLIDHW